MDAGIASGVCGGILCLSLSQSQASKGGGHCRYAEEAEEAKEAEGAHLVMLCRTDSRLCSAPVTSPERTFDLNTECEEREKERGEKRGKEKKREAETRRELVPTNLKLKVYMSLAHTQQPT